MEEVTIQLKAIKEQIKGLSTRVEQLEASRHIEDTRSSTRSTEPVGESEGTHK